VDAVHCLLCLHVHLLLRLPLSSVHLGPETHFGPLCVRRIASALRVQRLVHEVRLDGSAPQLFAARVPRIQRGRAGLPAVAKAQIRVSRCVACGCVEVANDVDLACVVNY
jgi:hypothetical protein